MKAAQPVNPQQSTALGLNLRKVQIQQIVPSRGVAICVDTYNHSTEVPYRVQPGKGRIPQEGEVWYIDRTLGTLWSFRAFVATSDADFQSFPTGLTLPDGQQILVGTVPTSVTATMGVRRASATDAVLGFGVGTDTSSRWAVFSDGNMEWGPGGTTARDVQLFRSAANVLSTNGSLTVAGAITKTLQTWQTPSYGTNWAGSTTFNGLGITGQLQYRLDAEDNVWLIGCFKATGAVSNPVFTLPTGFRPALQWPIPVLRNNGGTVTSGMAYVSNSGNLSLFSQLNMAATSGNEYVVNGKVPLGNIS